MHVYVMQNVALVNTLYE